MSVPSLTDTTPNPIKVWSGWTTNPFGYLVLTTPVQFTWDAIYGSSGTITITLTSPDGRSDLGTLSDPNTIATNGFNWDAATHTYTQRATNGPRPGSLLPAGTLLKGVQYTAPTLAAGDKLTVEAHVSYTSVEPGDNNAYPEPTHGVTVTTTDPTPLVFEVGGSVPTSGPIDIGTGPDTLILNISEDAYKGDAKFLITVNGRNQFGGIQTATASHKAGATQPFVLHGDFSQSLDSYLITFLNDEWDGTATTDRNLYLDSATYNGSKVPNSGFSLFANGSGYNAVQLPDIVLPVVVPPMVFAPVIGSGPDNFQFVITEDAYQGDAQFIIKIDGKQYGDIQTATIPHGRDQQQVFQVSGNFPSGFGHTASITYLNDAWGGTVVTDRNLYVEDVFFNFSNLDVSPQAGAMFSAGTMDFVRPGSGFDKLVVSLSGDQFQGVPEAKITFDGKQIAHVSVSALHPFASTDIEVFVNYGPGSHVLGVNYVNDAYGGTSATDRNLYLDAVGVNGIVRPGATGSLFTEGNVNFII